ncbi:hypothetical protein R6Q59_018168 [Mikania micrantha]
MRGSSFNLLWFAIPIVFMFSKVPPPHPYDFINGLVMEFDDVGVLDRAGQRVKKVSGNNRPCCKMVIMVQVRTGYNKNGYGSIQVVKEKINSADELVQILTASQVEPKTESTFL